MSMTSHTPAPSPDEALSVVNLGKTYKAQATSPAKQALCDVTLQVPRGSIFGLLGPNGAGKSTLINTLAGLVSKDTGTAHIWGFDIDDHPRQARASIGVVPQELSIDPFFTPAEILDLQAGLYGVPRRERRTTQILDIMGLRDKADVYTRTLSGGMRRRLLVAKAMVHAPPVLVLDEPTAGVDIELRRSLWDYVLELNAQGVTIMLTTHYLEEAQALCDEIAIINHGAVVAHDTTDNLLRLIDNKTLLVRPASPLTQAPDIVGEIAGQIPNIKCTLRDNGMLAIEYNPSACQVADLFAALAAANITIADIDTEGAHLESVFLKLTSG
ncbi:MAG: ABC transporter ATP-binding protein [Alphaproteobacteria bacterium]|nr:ABC transporter ATP-binding protein [Alphaproteobacteria bacterium]MBE8220262.1 ABC transporter ATP-binding protein [Alphaproteobacteria bacterium]